MSSENQPVTHKPGFFLYPTYFKSMHYYPDTLIKEINSLKM